MPDKIQCVIYARLSDKSDGDNIENQIYVCEEYAKQNDYQILEYYRDDGVSGRSPVDKRPAMSKMFHDLKSWQKQGKAGIVVLMKTMSREARSMRVSFEIDDLIEKYKAKVVYATEGEGYDITTARGRYEKNNMRAKNQFEAEISLESSKGTMDTLSAKGQYLSGAFYGMKPIKKILHKVDGEWENVLKVFEKIKDGSLKSYKEVQDFLNVKGANIKSQSTIPKLLSRIEYTGYRMMDNKLVINTDDSVVSHKLYKEVQKIISQWGRKGKPLSKPSNDFVLAKYLKCSACESILTPHSPKSKNKKTSHQYYVCTNKKFNDNGKCEMCDKYKGLSKEVIEDNFVKLLLDLDFNLRYSSIINGIVNQKFEEDNEFVKSHEQHLKNQRVEAEKSISNLMATLTNYSSKNNDTMVKRIETEIAKLESKQTEIDKKLSQLSKSTTKVEDLIAYVTKCLLNPFYMWENGTDSDRKTIVALVLAKPVIYDRNDGFRDIEFQPWYSRHDYSI